MLLCSSILFISCMLSGQAYRWDVGIVNEMDFTRKQLDGAVNSDCQNYFPYISLDNHTLLFSRKGHPMNFGTEDNEDIWISYKNETNQWSKAVNASSSINCSAADYLVGMRPSGNTFYVMTFGEGDEGQRLYARTKQGRSWSEPEMMMVDSAFQIKSWSSSMVSTSGEVLLLSLKDGKQVGGFDLYVAFREGRNSWSKPMNLGKQINSRKDELSVFLAPDETTLYFSSNGHKGFGKQDLFVSRRLDDSWTNWSAPINMGDQINSKSDDMYLTIPARGQVAYFSSYDKDGARSIYQANLPETLQSNPVQVVEGKIVELSQGVLSALEQATYNPLLDELLTSNSGEYIGVITQSNPLNFFEEVDGYYPQIENEFTSLDELDKDEFNLLGSIQDEQVGYFQREAEIEMIQVHLHTLQEEVKEHKLLYKLELMKYAEQFDRFQLNLANDLPGLVYSLPDTIPAGQPSTEEKEAKAKELAELKSKFFEYYKVVEDDDDEEYLWGEAVGFEDFRSQIESELKYELTPIVERELKLKLYGEVKEELAGELDAQTLALLESNEENLREQIKQSFGVIGGTGFVEAEPQPETLEMADWQVALKKELKETLEEQVKGDLAMALESEVRSSLKKQMAFISKKTEEDKWQRELDSKVEKQIAEEKSAGTDVEGLIPLSFSFQPADGESATFEVLQQDLRLLPTDEGQVIRLSNVSFSPNSAVLKPKSYSELDRLATFLKKNSSLEVEISSHTNGWVSHAFAQELSDKRAQVVVHYLKEKGVTEQQLTAVGYGKKKPLASNETLEGRRRNQRIEFKILKN